jgi:hypothetical protein
MVVKFLKTMCCRIKQSWKNGRCGIQSDGKKKMSNLRKTISRRLVEAKNTTAMLPLSTSGYGNIMATGKV